MNRIYKVIWNKTLNCWVAVSEHAKSSKKSSKSVAVGGTVLLSLSTLTFAAATDDSFTATDANGTSILNPQGLTIQNGPMLNTSGLDLAGLNLTNIANGVNPDDAVNKSQLDAVTTHYLSVNDGGTPSGNYNNDGAKGSNTVAIGVGAQTAGYSNVAIGSTAISGAAQTGTGGNSVSLGNSAYSYYNDIAIGLGAQATSMANVDATTTGIIGRNIAIGTNAQAGTNSGGGLSIAIGEDSSAKDFNSMAVGTNSNATRDGTAVGQGTYANYGGTSLGNGAQASNAYDTAVGYEANSSGSEGVAIGRNATSSGNMSSAIGTRSQALLDHSVALGSDSVANTAAGVEGYNPITGGSTANTSSTWTSTAGAVSVGNVNNNMTRQITGVAAGTADTDAVNIAQLKAGQTHYYSVNDGGNPSSNYNNDGATGIAAVAQGINTTASGNYALASGAYSNASGSNSVALGLFSNATADGAVGIGNSAKANGVISVAIGQNANATASQSTAVGSYNNATNLYTTVVGSESVAAGWSSVAVGWKASALSDGDVAIGGSGNTPTVANGGNGGQALAMIGAQVYGGNSIGIGAHTQVGSASSPSDYTVAIGYNSSVNGTSNISLGFQTAISGANAIGIGTNSIVSSDNAIAMGLNSNAAGINSIALGSSSATSQNNDIAIGVRANANGPLATAIGTYSNASGAFSTAIGPSATALNNGSFAGGSSAISTGNNSAAIGTNASAGSDNAIAVGLNSNAAGINAISLGSSSTASANNNIAIGVLANSSGLEATAIGARSNASGNHATSLGVQSSASGENSFAQGWGSNASGQYSIALGEGVQATTFASTAMGAGAQALGGQATALGYNSLAAGFDAFAQGEASRALGNYSIAIGLSSLAQNDSDLAIGNNVKATGGASVALGNRANSAGVNSTAVGNYSSASGSNAVAVGNSINVSGASALSLGNRNVVTGNNSSALGSSSNVAGNNSASVGNNNNIAQDNTFATGNNITTTQANSVVLGNNSTDRVATTENSGVINGATYQYAGTGSEANGVVSVGSVGAERQVINVAAGNVSATSTDAVNGSQLYATNQAIQAAQTHYYSVNGGGKQGANYNNDGATGANAIASGVNATASASNGIAMGLGATAASANNSIAIGNSANVQTLAGIAIGNGATVNAKNTQGTGEGYWGVALGNNSNVNGEYGVAIGGGGVGSGAGGSGTNTSGVHGVAVGYNSNAGYNSTALGYMASAPGNYSSFIETGYSVAVGYKAATGSLGYGSALGAFSNASGLASTSIGNNSASSGTGSVALGGGANTGAGAQATGSTSIAIGGAGLGGTSTIASARNAIALGTQANVSGTSAVGIGANTNVSGASSIGIGSAAIVANKNTVAIGNGIKSTQDNSVLLGNATTDRAATTEAGMMVAGVAQTFAGQGSATNGVVSVGAAGKERQVINVAAGNVSATSTDAINGSQLFAVSNGLKSAGMNYVSDNGTTVHKNLGETLNILGGATGALSTGNIGVNTDANGNVNVELAQNLDLSNVGSVTTGQTVLNNTGVTVGNNIALTSNGLTAGNIIADANTGKITGLSNGDVSSTSTDAINGSQLYGVSNSYKTVLGGNAVVNSDGTVTTSNIGGTGKDNVNDAIQAVDTTAKASKSTVVSGKNTVVTPTVNTDGSTDYEVATADDVNFNSVTSNKVTVGNIVADSATNKISGLANGLVNSTSSDAINGSQLYGVSNSYKTVIGGNAVVNPDGTVITSDIGGTGKDNVNDAIQAVDTTAKASKSTVVAGKNTVVTPTVNADGSTDYAVATADDVNFNSVTVGTIKADSTTNKISGLTNGAVSNNSTDAINGSQLYGVSKSYKTVLGGNATVNPDGTVTTSDIGGTGKDNVNDAIQAVDTTAKASKSTVVAGKNTVVTPTVNTDGSTDYEVATADDVNFNSVTVGAIKADATTNKISGLSNGAVNSGSTDAINGSQLYGVSNSYKTVIGGNAVVNPDGTVTTSNIGGTGKDNVNDAIQAVDITAKASKATVVAGKNTVVTPTVNTDGSTDYEVATADDVNFNSVTVGTIKADSATNKISGLANGLVNSTSSDAINGSQLYGVSNSYKTVIGGNAVVNPDGTVTTSNIGGTGKDNVNDAIQAVDTTAKASKATVVAGKNTVVTPTVNTDGSTDYEVATADDVNFNSITVGTIKADATTNKITGLANGLVNSTSSDAINGSQLYGVSNSYKTVIGGNTVVNPDGTVTTSNIGGTGKDNVNDAIQAVDTTAKASKSTVVAGKNTVVTPTVNADGSTDYVVATVDDVNFNSVTSNKVAVGNIIVDSASNKISGLANGTVSSTSTDAINGSQLANVSKSVSSMMGGNAVVNPDGTVTTSNIGGTGKDNVNDAIQAVDITAKASKATVVAGKNTVVTPTVNADGSTDYAVATADDVNFNSVTVGAIKADSATNKITGLANGLVNSTSSDAINGSQLYGVSNSYKTVIGGNAVVNPDGTVTTSNIGGTGKDNVNDAIQAVDTTAKASKSTVVAGKNTVVTPTVNTDGSTDYEVATADDVNFNSVTVGAIKADSATNKITGLANGLVNSTSSDAINGSQLYGVSNSYKTVIGGNATVNTDGTLTTSNIGGTGKDNVNDAIQAVDTIAKASKATVVAGKNTVVTPTVNTDGSTDYAVATADDVNFNSVTSNKVTVGNIVADSDTNKISGLANGLVNSTSSDAINGSQLYGVSNSYKTVLGGNAVVNPDGTINVSNLGGTGKDNINDAIQAIDTTAKASKSTVVSGKNTVVTSTVNADGSTEYAVATADDVNFNSVNSNKVTVGNIVVDSVTNKISGLANGAVNSTSTDAINGSQLANVSKSVSSMMGGNATVNSDGTISVSNIGNTGKDNVNDAISAVQSQATQAKSTVSAGDNVVVNTTKNADGSTNYQVQTAKDVNFDSVKSDQVTVGNVNIDSTTNKITGIENGTVSQGSKDAINGGQLSGVSNSVAGVIGGNAVVNADGTISTNNIGGTGKNTIDDAIASVKSDVTASKTTVSSGKNTVVNKGQNTDGSTNYTVDLANDINVNSVTASDVNATNVNATNVTSDNVKVGNVTINSSSNKVTGLANGDVSKTSTDAVNGSQLYTSNQNMANYLGGGSTVNSDGSTSAPTYNVAGGKFNDVGSALNAVDNRVSNLEQAFYQTDRNIQNLKNQTNAAIAGALAVGNLPQPTEAGMSMVSAGLGGYRGEGAVAVGVSAITDSNKYVWKMGASADSRSNVSGAVSVGYQWK